MKPEMKPEKAKPPKKLKLKKETLRELTDEEAAKVKGGQKTTNCSAVHPF